MRIATAIARLNALPALHRAIASALAVGVIAASCLLPLLLPPQFTSFAVLANHPTAAQFDGDNAQLAAQASAILSGLLDSDLLDSGLLDSGQLDTHSQSNLASTGPSTPANSRELAAAERQVTLTQLSPTQLRLTYTGRSETQAQAAVEACAALLLAWRAHTSEVGRQPAKPQPQDHAATPPSTSDPSQDREQALLRVTIAVLDARIAELRAGQQTGTAQESTAQARAATGAKAQSQIPALLHQRQVLLARLAESPKNAPQQNALQPDAPPQAPITNHRDASSAALESPSSAQFTLMQPATPAQPSPSFPPQWRSWGILAGILLGFAYLAFALWLFRPIQDIAALQKLLPGEILLAGSIGDFHS
jgi:hypothetical protein